MSSQRSRRPANVSDAEAAQRNGNGVSNGISNDDKSRAERFEDEKTRIIDSCFLKKEPDGAYAESYITHIPVIEDASSPSSPPPPTSTESNKKPRVIIVAVRRSGRVRLHKARENSNKTFSIGKTWQLDHLSAIESFTGNLPPSQEEQQRKQWGGSTGMLITIQKPYFWQAASQKEKDFFIGSLVKIFKKYTGGTEPTLTGFSPQELSAFTPSSSARPKTPQTSSVGARPSPIPSPAIRPPPPGSSTPSLIADSSTSGLRPPSAPREGRPRYTDPASSQETLSSTHQEFQTPPPPPLSSGRAQSRERRSPRAPLPTPAQDAVITPQPSQEFRPPPAPMRSPERPRTAARSPVRSPMQPPARSLARSPSRPERPEKPEQAAEPPPPEELPERRRPPIESTNSTLSEPAEVGRKIEEPPLEVASPTDSFLNSPAPGEPHRPGLGPMIKKKSAKDIAGKFRSAAAAANAFRPRAGGAGDRLRSESDKPAGPAADGINGVFPAPSTFRDGLRSPMPPLTPTTASVVPTPEVQKDDPLANASTPSLVPDTPEPPPAKVAAPAPTPEKPKAPVSEEKKIKRPSTHYAKYARAIGIDPILLEGRTADTEAILEEFGWGEEEKKKVSLDDLQNGIRRDLAKVETGSWLGSLEEGDDRVAQVGKLLDKAIAECEEMDGLLTLYNVELGTLHEDVAYIEAQSQGLQVQTANQRLLHSELKNLQETISVSSSQLRALKDASLSRPDGIEAIEQSLVQLFKAMLTIDPKLKQHGRPHSADSKDTGNTTLGIGAEISTMRAVKEKKQGYENQCNAFIIRLRDQMNGKFQESESITRDNLGRTKIPTPNSKLNSHARDAARELLWPYSPLMLFVREVSRSHWEALIQMYETSSKRLYTSECRDNFSEWKAVAKKPTGDHEEVLFTQQEKEVEGTSLVGRKLTVKRSKTLREGPRMPNVERGQDGKIPGYEAFAGALFDTASSLVLEQNFISDMFHVSSLETAEFPDLVASMPPEARRGTDLSKFRNFDPDRNMAKRLQSVMDEMFSFWPSDIQNLVDWVVTQDPLQGIGILFALESKIAELEDSNQEYIVNTLQQVHGRLNTRFDRFVEEQIRGIEDTKVKIKKRKGVILFIKIFPYFVAAVEQMLPPQANNVEVREKVNSVYERINRSMFESLKFIAKESPVVMAGQKSQGQAGGDSEDKEILNYHILLIQNMNHYSEEVQPQGNPTLDEWKKAADKEMAEHMNLYVSAVIRRPLGKLLDSIESIEALLASSSGESPTSVAQKPSHSRSLFKKLLSDFEAKDVRHKIDALKKRVEKHFGEADDPGLSRNLVVKVLRECEDRYVDILIRTNRIVRDVYEGDLEVDFKREDIHSAFRRN